MEKKFGKRELRVANLRGSGAVMKNCGLDGNNIGLKIKHIFL